MDVVGSLVLLYRGYCMKKKPVELDCLYRCCVPLSEGISETLEINFVSGKIILIDLFLIPNQESDVLN